MFAKLSSVVVLTLAAFAVAGDHVSSSYDCNTGSVQCCGQLSAPNNYDVNIVKALIGVATAPISGQVGFQCNPISVIGVGSAGNCAGGAQCCKDYHSASLVGVDCSSAIAQV